MLDSEDEIPNVENLSDVIGNNPRVVPVGAVAVDSGQIMITDPYYLKDFKSNEYQMGDEDFVPDEFSYNTVSHVTNPCINRNVFAQTYRDCVFASPSDDGFYPIYAILDEDGKPKQLIIDFENYVDDNWLAGIKGGKSMT
jgi:hypothetical protein